MNIGTGLASLGAAGAATAGTGGLALPLIALGGSLGMNIFGQSQSARANNKYMDFIQGRINDLDTWYKKKYNTPFIQTDAAQSVLSRLTEQMTDETEKLDNNAVRTGQTAESKVAAKGELQKNYGRALSDLVGQGTAYKDRIQNQYMMRLSDLLNQKGSALQGKSQNWSNFSGNVGDMSSSLLQAYGAGAFG